MDFFISNKPLFHEWDGYLDERGENKRGLEL